MTTIYKQVIQPNSVKGTPFLIEFEAPCDARPVSVGMQNGQCCVWFECNPKMAKDKIKIYCVGTGFGAVPAGGRFIGTVIDDPYVWHFYTLIP